MTELIVLTATCLVVLSSSGCTLQEVRGRTNFGPEYRHLGSNSTNENRWTVEQGVQLKWSNGVDTGVSYRRRDTDDGSGNNDNRILLELSYPLWKAENKKEKALLRRLEALENRLAALEAQADQGVQP